MPDEPKAEPAPAAPASGGWFDFAVKCFAVYGVFKFAESVLTSQQPAPPREDSAK